MKIVNILGGLGNQMFQYAFAYSLKKEFPDEDIQVYTGSFNGYPLHNGFELDRIFDLTIPLASNLDVVKLFWPIGHYRLWQVAHHFLPARYGLKEGKDKPISEVERKKFSYFEGYFQWMIYYENIRSELQTLYKFPPLSDAENKLALKFATEEESTSIHIRRGDYINNPLYDGICTLDYYKKALATLKKHTKTKRLLVFSNDIEWCKDVLDCEFKYFEVLYVDWNKGENSFRDMHLMSLCNHNIIANSSFSWWGAWLNSNPNQIVIAPRKWDNSSKCHDRLLFHSWITI